MWTIVLLLSLLSVQMYAQSSQEKHDSGRVVVQGSGALRNYTISFVPLLAVLANMIPQLITKLQPTITTTTQARKLRVLNAWEERSLCQLSKIKKWPNPNDDCEFYSCTFNTSISTDCSEQIFKREDERNAVKVRMIPLNLCSFLQLYRCKGKYYFNKITGECESCSDLPSCCQTKLEQTHLT